MPGMPGMPGMPIPGPGPAMPDQASPTPTADGATPGATPRSRKSSGDTNEIATLTLTFRAVSLKDISGKPEADKDIAYAVEEGLQSSPFFDPDKQETHTTSDVIPDEQTKTFTFTVVARLKHPLKL
jgi:hypothetical protein